MNRQTTAREDRLSIRNLRKEYRGGVVANDDLCIEVRPGEVFGLLGPNGAGKTTLVNQVIGLLKPTSGTIHLGGIDLVERPQAARRLCSYLPQGHLPIDAMKLQEAVELMGRIRGGPRPAVRARIDRLMGALEMEEWRHQLGSRVSGGVLRLVGFLMAAVWPGRVVILDEPTNDVDPLRRRLLWREIRALAEDGSAVLLVTHNVLEADRAVDRLAVIDRGRIVAEGTPTSMKAGERGRLRLQVTLEPSVEEFPRPPFGVGWSRAGRKMLVAMEESEALAAIEWARGLTRGGVAEEYELGAANLEDTYVRLIGREDVTGLEVNHEHAGRR